MRTKEEAREYNERYYAENKERIKQESSFYYHNNKEKALENVRKYREENKEIINEKGREYYRRKHKSRLLYAAKARAKKSGLAFDITENDFDMVEYCPLLNIPLFITEGRKSVKPNSPSMDRIDSTKGYVKGNVWIISYKANTMKSNSTLEEFILLAKNWKHIHEKTLSSV
jgi:hypothetical protein